MKNEDAKVKDIIEFVAGSDVAVSGSAIEKGTGIFWKDVYILLDKLVGDGQLKLVRTTSGNFYELRV